MGRPGFRDYLLGAGAAAGLPTIALVFFSIARPTTFSLMAVPTLVGVIALAGLASIPAFPPRWWLPVAAFSLATLAWLAASLMPRWEREWEILGGPGLDAPGPFRVHRLSEVAALVAAPYVAIGVGLLAALFIRFAPRKLLVALAFLAVAALIWMLLMPQEQ